MRQPKTIEEMLKLRTRKDVILSFDIVRDICRRIKKLEKIKK